MNSSKGNFEGQGRPRFKRSFSNKGSTSSPMVDKYKVCNPKPQVGNSSGSSMESPKRAKSIKKHDGKCVCGCVWYGFGKSGHQLTNFPILAQRAEKNYYDAPKKNYYDALQS